MAKLMRWLFSWRVSRVQSLLHPVWIGRRPRWFFIWRAR